MSRITSLVLFIFFAAPLLGATAVGCSDDGSSTQDAAAKDFQADAGADAAQPWTPPFDPTVCKTKSYAWLPPNRMGKIISKEKSLLFSLSKDAINAMASLTEYKDVLKAKHDVVVYLYRYETQDRGLKTEATAAMAYPVFSDTKQHAASYVLWLHGTCGFSDKCAPTRAGADAALPVALMASQGYIGVAPDYLGMNGLGKPSTMPHPYLVGEPTAIASLDSLRGAGKILTEVGAKVKPDRRVLMWGASQGGHATFFSMLYAPYYAPEFTVAGALALIAPPNVKAQVEASLASYTDSSAISAAAVTALSRWYCITEPLDQVLTNTAPHHFSKLFPQLMDSECSFDQSKYKVTQINELFTDKFIAAAKGGSWQGYDTWSCILAENSLPSSSVKPKNHPPVLYVVAENDELVHASQQRISFDLLCQEGYQMEYLECKGANHVQGGTWSLSEQFDWAADRLAGKPLTQACKRSAAVCCKGSDKAPCK